MGATIYTSNKSCVFWLTDLYNYYMVLYCITRTLTLYNIIQLINHFTCMIRFTVIRDCIQFRNNKLTVNCVRIECDGAIYETKTGLIHTVNSGEFELLRIFIPRTVAHYIVRHSSRYIYENKLFSKFTNNDFPPMYRYIYLYLFFA